MSIGLGPSHAVAIIKDDIDKVKSATAGAEKACKAFEEADLAKIFGAANAVSSALSIVALGVQIVSWPPACRRPRSGFSPESSCCPSRW